MTASPEWPPSPWLPPDPADDLGLVGVGGSLHHVLLLRAYHNGIFPWFNDHEPVAWWSPDPRAVFELDGLYISKRLARTVRSGKFTSTRDRAFREVMLGCGDREAGTWVTESMIEAYTKLHAEGAAHSVEVWMGQELVGGVYGVEVGAVFCAESMFYREPDASKVALVYLFEHLRKQGFVLVDTQMLTDHTRSMGATLIPRRDYLRRLTEGLGRDVRF